MPIPDAINLAGKHLQELNGNRPITREAIIKETLKYGNWSPASVIPSDFCYNRTNVAARPEKYWVFLMVDPNRDEGLYIYVGRNYNYKGPVIANPRTLKAFPVASAKAATNTNVSDGSSTGIERPGSEAREIWNSKDPERWKRALDRYWTFVKPSNLALEREMGQIDADIVKAMSPEGWYKFLLEKYFRWKYTAENRYVSTTNMLRSYEIKNELHVLHGIKDRLFLSDKNDTQQCLAAANTIRGLGTAGASGLIAVLFPAHFGTVDQFAVKALAQIPELPERALIAAMNSESLKLHEGALLIRIMRCKATELNMAFSTTEWTPRKVDMVLWTCAR